MSDVKPRTKTLGVIESLGRRLQSDERPPYDVADHDETVSFDDPTGDVFPPGHRHPRKESDQ